MTAHKRKKSLCFCGHKKLEHTEYINGVNSKGSKYVCTKDNCHLWSYCDLQGDISRRGRMNFCIICGVELRTTGEVDKCIGCQNDISSLKSLEPKPSAYIGIKCPYCNNEISLLVYKAIIKNKEPL